MMKQQLLHPVQPAKMEVEATFCQSWAYNHSFELYTIMGWSGVDLAP